MSVISRYLDIRYECDGTLGLQFHADSSPPFAVARITPGSLTAEHPDALAGMVLVSIAGQEVEAEADYGEVLNQLRRASRPLELRFQLPDEEEEEEDHPDGPVENEGVLAKLERDTTFHRGYTPHPRFFVLRADGLVYFRLFLAGVGHGMGDTVTSGTGRLIPFSDTQAVVPGSDLPPELINAPPSAEGADSPEGPHWAVDDGDEEDKATHTDLNDPFAQAFALSSPTDRTAELELEREVGGVGVGDGAEGALTEGGGSAEAGEECRFTIVMGDRHVGSGGYQKPWRLYRLQAGSASDRDAWLGCIRGGMARYREHGPWALRPRNPPAAAQAVVSATVARTLTRPDSKHRARLGPKGAGARTAGGATGTPRAAGAAADDGVSDGTATASTLPFYRRPYTRYIVEYRTQANTHGEVARRFDEFRQLHAKVLEPVSSPAAPLVLPPAHQPTDILADKNDPELVAYRASELQQYISSAVRLVSRLNAPPVRYALDHFLTHQGIGRDPDQLVDSKAVVDLLSRQQLWDAVGHWRGEESAGLLGVTTTDAAGTVTGRRSPAWFGLNLDPEGSAEMTIAHEGSLMARLLGRWESCGGGRRLHLSLSGSSTVTGGADTADADSIDTHGGNGSTSTNTMSRAGGVSSYCSWGLELTWRKVCVESSGRSADTSREYTVYHISCVQSCVSDLGGHISTVFAPGSAPEPEPEPRPEQRWVVSARYSGFESLRQLLLASADRNLSAEIAAMDELFPAKATAAAWIMPQSSTAERQARLLGWLRAVHRVAPQHPAVLAFLAPPQTKSNTAFGDDPHGPHSPDSSEYLQNGGGSNHLHSVGSSMPGGTTWSSQDGTVPNIADASAGAAGGMPAEGARGRGVSVEFVMPDGDDVYSDYPDNHPETAAGARASRGLVRTISNIGIQGLNTPRAAHAVEAGAAGDLLSNRATTEAASVSSTAGYTAAMKLSLCSAGPPTVHNAGVAWSDSFGNAVERRRLVLESCLRSDVVSAGTKDGDGTTISKHYAEGEVGSSSCLYQIALSHHSSTPSLRCGGFVAAPFASCL